MEGLGHQRDCEIIRQFVRESVGFRLLGGVLVGGLSAIWIDPFLGVVLTIGCVLGVFTELLTYNRFCRSDSPSKFPRKLALATFFNMSVFAVPIPVVAMQGSLGLMFLAAIYACAGIIYPIIGYRSRKALMMSALAPYIIATALAAAAIYQYAMLQGEP